MNQRYMQAAARTYIILYMYTSRSIRYIYIYMYTPPAIILLPSIYISIYAREENPKLVPQVCAYTRGCCNCGLDRSLLGLYIYIHIQRVLCVIYFTRRNISYMKYSMEGIILFFSSDDARWCSALAMRGLRGQGRLKFFFLLKCWWGQMTIDFISQSDEV